MQTITRIGLLCLASLPLAAATLQDVIQKMDQAAPKFTGMSADLRKLGYTKVIDDKSEETGSILLRRGKARDLQVRIDFTQPDPKMVGFRGRKAEIYFPKMKTVQEYDLGKSSDLIDQFLLLGFGTSGRDLQANYTMKYIGDEAVAGSKSHKLELIPNAAQRREKLSKLELWIAEDGSHPVQQKFIEPSGNYTVFTYSGVKMNPPLTDEALALKLPKGVKRERPQK